jgi:hypothetical protein
MSEASLPAYPLPSAALRPSWVNRRSRLLALFAIAACLIAFGLETPIGLAEIDDITLRILFPGGLAFVLAFAPTPATRVGRVARDLTVLGLAAAMFVGDRVPVMLACYPLVLMASVAIDWTRQMPAGRTSEK